MRLNDYTTEPFIINTGIPQGSPLSSIIYLFYNADLLEACSQPSTYSTSIGYIDDMAILAIEDTAEENCQTLAAIHERAKTWAFKHASIFAEDKYELIHFMRPCTPQRTAQAMLNQPLILPNRIIHPSKSSKYLGIILNPKLDWTVHLREVEATAA